MSFEHDVAELEARIRTAESQSDYWRSAGRQEKHLEAYFLVDALELELIHLRESHGRKAGRARTAAEDSSPPSAAAPASARKRLMLEFGITFSGRQYQYAQYRYDRLEDAVAYARQQLASPSADDAADSLPPARSAEAPDDLQRRRMLTHGITFENGVYNLGPYRYDRLDDALRYAQLPHREALYTTSRP